MFDEVISVFDITDHDLENRDYIYRLVKKNKKLISSEFYNFLQKNTYTKTFLVTKEKISRLSRTQEDFQENLFSMDFADLIPYIYNVGLVHYRINLDNTYVISSHTLLKNIYTKIIFYEDISNKYELLVTIEKFLGLSLGIMISSYYEKSDVCLFDIRQIKKLLEALSDLKVIHKMLLDEHIDKFEKGEEKELEYSLSNYESCQFHVTLTKFKTLSRFQDVIDVEDIIENHRLIHKQGAELLNEYKQGKILRSYFTEKLRKLSEHFTQHLNDIIRDFITSQSDIFVIDFVTLVGDIIRMDYKVDLNTLLENFVDAIAEFSYFVKDVDFVDKDYQEGENEIIFLLFIDKKNYYVRVKIYHETAKVLLQSVLKISLDLFQELYIMHSQEKKLGDYADKVSESDRMKTLFIANVSHEIRTPLNSILGFAQLIQMKKNIDETTKKYVSNIIEAGNKLLEHINKVIDFARLESGKAILNIKEINLKTLANKVQSIVSPLLSKKNLKLNIDFPQDIKISVDAKMIEDVFINLVSNAIKFSENGSSIDMGCIVTDKGYKFFVKDYGIGFSEEHKEKIFSSFYQVEESYSNPIKGSGLGLAIVKSVVEKHGGNVWAESEPGKGSEFWFYIPKQ